MSRNSLALLPLVALLGCPQGPDAECGGFDQVFVWTDGDGDGFGVDPIGWVCQPGQGQATNSVDCDDANPDVHPTGEEVCDLVDNDCNGAIDETVAKSAWYPDADGDGYGADQNADFACAQPSAIHITISGDCDDALFDVSPGSLEVCNEIDDDCDGLVDDADGGVDPLTRTNWYPDLDLDGYGDASRSVSLCQGPPGSIEDGTDCDDTRDFVNPGITEVCNDEDDDCDGLIDDYDPSVDPASQDTYYEDLDFDGYGNPAVTTLHCEPVYGAADNGDDCDDTDPIVTIPTDWYLDVDGDGYGSGAPLSYGCYPPGSGTGPGVFGLDCDETDVAVNPGASEICGDGIDNDCAGGDRPCAPIGSYLVEWGANWTTDPPVRSCIEACALLFGGVDTDYHCSTTAAVQNNLAYLSGWGDAFYCSNGAAEDWKLEPAANPGYNCGTFSCAYSAYVQDNCFGSRNYCWLR